MSEKIEANPYEAEHIESEEEYYLKAFKRLDEYGKHTWNWAAFLFGSSWMAYRKMYLYALFLSIITGIFEFCACLLLSFNIYGHLVSRHLLENEYPYLYLFVILCPYIISGVFVGYFGNAMYHRTIKKKIKKGYHLLEKYSPTSIPSILCWPFICFADWIARKLQLKIRSKNEANEGNILAYLNPNKKIHWVVKIANILACLAFTAYFISDFAKKANNLPKNPTTQATTKHTTKERQNV